MEVVSSARASVLPVLGDAPRISAPPPPDAIKTELPAQATVQQGGAPEKPSPEKSRPEAGSVADVSRTVTIDAQTQDLVFQTISEESGEVLRQVPDQALLRIRAYSRELLEADAAPEERYRLSRFV